MDFLEPQNLLRFGYKDCILCDAERKGEEKRCENCSGLLDQRERLLWEIRRERIRRKAGRLSLVFPGLGHFYDERYASGIFWVSLLFAGLGLVLNLWKGFTLGHAALLAVAALVWWLAWVDVRRGPGDPSAPCELACPAGIQVADYIALVRENRPLEALALVYDKLPFAAFCGRACPHPCEQECVRNEFEAPISIMAIKRYAADLGAASGVLPHPEAGEGGKAFRVAVVGAGPAGLTAADTLARLGSRVTVYDSNEEPGGVMRYGVSEFRFPREASRYDMERILSRGILFHGGGAVGRDVSFPDLEQGSFDAILIAGGTPEAFSVPGCGTEEQGFHVARSFLDSVRRNRPVRIRGRVVVVGGGDVAIDSARTALRLGASEVTVVCIESREKMPAHPWEVEDALAEGVKILPSSAVVGFPLQGGQVVGVETLPVERFDIDAEGRIVPRTVGEKKIVLPADSVVMAVGSRPEMGFLPEKASRVPVDERNHVCRLIFRDRKSRIPIYLFGDCVSGPGTVVEASASGRAAALNIYSDHCVICNSNTRYRDNYRRRREPHEPDRPEWRIRRKGARLSLDERRGNFDEVEKGFSGECARAEAERCARCNLTLLPNRKGGEKG